MTRAMQWGVALMFLALYGRTFGSLILDGWLDCAFMSVGLCLWIYQKRQ